MSDHWEQYIADMTAASKVGKEGDLAHKITELEAKLMDTERKCQDRERAHAEELKALHEAHANELKALREAHAEELKNLREAHANELKDLCDAHADEITNTSQKSSNNTFWANPDVDLTFDTNQMTNQLPKNGQYPPRLAISLANLFVEDGILYVWVPGRIYSQEHQQCIIVALCYMVSSISISGVVNVYSKVVKQIILSKDNDEIWSGQNTDKRFSCPQFILDRMWMIEQKQETLSIDTLRTRFFEPSKVSQEVSCQVSRESASSSSSGSTASWSSIETPPALRPAWAPKEARNIHPSTRGKDLSFKKAHKLTASAKMFCVCWLTARGNIECRQFETWELYDDALKTCTKSQTRPPVYMEFYKKLQAEFGEKAQATFLSQEPHKL